MDFDRKSAVSSFYGARRSVDALNTDFPTSSDRERPRRDSASTFFNPNAGLPPGAGAGYNRMSYMDPGRVEPVKGAYDEGEDVGMKDDSWDVYADFNNAGPRYSTAFGQTNTGYREIPPAAFKADEEASLASGPVEMVTVPALGPEWKADELRDMTGRGKREKRSDKRKEYWKAWNRDERGCCGGRFTRRFTVWFLFGTCCVVGFVLAFTIPRVPGLSFNSNTPLLNSTASIPVQFSRSPANFTFPAYADLQADTSSNFLPLVFNSLDAEVYDLGTDLLVGTGHLGKKTLPAKAMPDLQLPLNFTYVATNDSDVTWNTWYNACKNAAIYPDGTRPDLQFRLVLSMNILGLIGHRSASTTVTNAPCPVELAINAA